MTDINNPGNPEQETPEALKAKIAELEQAKTALVGETTELRKARQDKDAEVATLQEALRAATEQNNANPEEEKIRNVVQSILSESEKGRAQGNRKAAFDKFVTEHKEYHPDNDPSGLMKAALEREFAGFNTQGLVEVDDFIEVIGKAERLLRGDTTRQTEDTVQPYSSMSPSNPAPRTSGDKDLTLTEQILIQRNGWTKEKFLGLKAKMPEFIESLVAGVR